MIKKSTFLLVILCLLATKSSIKAMEEDNGIRELPRQQHEREYPEDEIGRRAYHIGLAQGIATRTAQRIIAQKSVSDALTEGALAGLEQGAATLVASCMIDIAKIGIAKGTQWWNQLSEEEQQELELQLHMKALIESMEKGIEKKQKLLAGNSTIIATAGEHVAKAQEIFNKHYTQAAQELETHINELIELESKKLLMIQQKNIEVFKSTLQKAHQQKLLEFQQEDSYQNIRSDIKKPEVPADLDPETLQKVEQYVEQEEILYEVKLQAFKENCEKVKKASLAKLEKESPEAKFAQLYGTFSDMALATVQEQRAMMDGTLIQKTLQMMEQQKKPA